MYEIVGRYQDAVDEYSEVVKLNPENSEYSLIALRWALIESKRYIEALVPLKKSIRLNPKNTDAYYSLGWVYGELKRYEEAIVALEETLQIDPNHLEAGTRLSTMKNYLKKVTAPKTGSDIDHRNFRIAR